MAPADERDEVARAFVRACAAGDLVRARALLADEFVGHITTASGDTRSVNAADYVASLEQMDIPTAALRLDVLDVTRVGDDAVLVMVEVHAERGGRTLHNFSGQLVTVAGGRIAALWMVEALPAESDRFWS